MLLCISELFLCYMQIVLSVIIEFMYACVHCAKPTYVTVCVQYKYATLGLNFLLKY